MKKLLSLLLLLALGLSCCAFAAEDTLTGVPQDEITAQWGSPEKLLNYTVGIWKRDGQTLVATFVTDPETQQLLVQDYVILDSERQLLAGTIPTEDTLFHVYDVVSSTAAAEIPGVVDVGSGAEIHAKITADGYVVCWQRDCPNVFTDLYLTVYDGVKGQEDGLKTAYLAYVMAQEDADVPYTLDELLTYFAPDAAEMAEVSAHEAVQQVDFEAAAGREEEHRRASRMFPECRGFGGGCGRLSVSGLFARGRQPPVRVLRPGRWHDDDACAADGAPGCGGFRSAGGGYAYISRGADAGCKRTRVHVFGARAGYGALRVRRDVLADLVSP